MNQKKKKKSGEKELAGTCLISFKIEGENQESFLFHRFAQPFASITSTKHLRVSRRMTLLKENRGYYWDPCPLVEIQHMDCLLKGFDSFSRFLRSKRIEIEEVLHKHSKLFFLVTSKW